MITSVIRGVQEKFRRLLSVFNRGLVSSIGVSGERHSTWNLKDDGYDTYIASVQFPITCDIILCPP